MDHQLFSPRNAARDVTAGQDGERRLRAILAPHVQVARWHRRANETIQSYLSTVATTGGLGSGFRTTLDPDGRLPSSLIPAGNGRDALVADINLLVTVFRQITSSHSTTVRLDVIFNRMCPRFHVDHACVRLLCTYRGHATQWIDDVPFLGSSRGADIRDGTDDDSGLFHRPTTIKSANSFDALLLKGALWPGNTGRGAVHRSPDVTSGESPRVLLIVEPSLCL